MPAVINMPIATIFAASTAFGRFGAGGSPIVVSNLVGTGLGRVADSLDEAKAAFRGTAWDACGTPHCAHDILVTKLPCSTCFQVWGL
jgi:hypothetical protein